MIYQYGLIHHYEKINAYLSIIFLDGHQDITPTQDDDCLIYQKDNQIYRIDIFNLKKYIKIRIQGLIVLPNYEFIAILNGYLGKYGILLAAKEDSGFFIDKVNNQYVVKVAANTLLANGTFVKEERIAKNSDLYINENDDLINLDSNQVNEKDLGKDFFQMEEKSYDRD